MNPSTLRVFLFSNSPQLLPLLSKLEEQLRTHCFQRYEPFLVSRQNLLSGKSSTAGREMQEGDLLITVGVPGAQQETLKAVHDHALTRKLIVFPFLLATDPENLSAETRKLFDKRLACTVLQASRGVPSLIQEISAVLHERSLFGSPETDLLLRRQAKKAPRDPFRARALDLLESDGRSASGELQHSAHETRRQAATAIRARLYEVALETLKRATEFDATSAITAYWMARVRLAQNTQTSLVDALRDANRAARIAALQGVKTTIEIASWRLAARICAMMGDLAGMQDHLKSAAAREPDQLDLKIENLRLLHRIGQREESLRILESLYANDRTAFRAVSEDPELGLFHTHLQNLRTRRESALRSVFEDIAAGEARLREARQKPAATPLESWDEDTTDSLEELEKGTNQSVETQLTLLNQWGTELIAATRRVHELQARRASILEASREIPERSDYDFLLEKIWPRIRRRFDSLEGALEQTEQLEKNLEVAEKEATRQLREEATQFTRHAEAFEQLLVRHAHLLREPDSHHQSLLCGLTVLKSGAQEIPSYAALLPEDLCEIIDFPPAATAPAQALYRLERDRHGREGASRVGVYFVEAKRKLS